jgi:hypothetical protein
MEVASPRVGLLSDRLGLSGGHRATVEQCPCLLTATTNDVNGVEWLASRHLGDTERRW